MQLLGVRPSVRPSLRLSRSTDAHRCCRFAAEGPAGSRYRSIAAAAGCSSSTCTAARRAAGECGQCHVVS